MRSNATHTFNTPQTHFKHTLNTPANTSTLLCSKPQFCSDLCWKALNKNSFLGHFVLFFIVLFFGYDFFILFVFIFLWCFLLQCYVSISHLFLWCFFMVWFEYMNLLWTRSPSIPFIFIFHFFFSFNIFFYTFFSKLPSRLCSKFFYWRVTQLWVSVY